MDTAGERWAWRTRTWDRTEICTRTINTNKDKNNILSLCSEASPLQALSGKDVCGVDDIFSDLHTSSWFKEWTAEDSWWINSVSYQKTFNKQIKQNFQQYLGRGEKSRQVWMKDAWKKTSCCRRGKFCTAWPTEKQSSGKHQHHHV